MMASSGRNTSSESPEMRQSVKAHLLASQELLVESLYNLAPLMDCALACGLLSQDNYYEVKAERTPPNRARKLLEVVHAQMDEGGASCFLECLKRCERHYPRLRTWLCHDPDIQRGPTERQLQAQFNVLCARLGHSILPVSLALFSAGIVTQFELDQVQSATTLYQQAQKLLRICLSKGESACSAFYNALNSEDEILAEEIRASGLPEALPVVSVESEPVVNNFPIAVEETSYANPEAAVAQPQSGVLQEVLNQLRAVSGEATLNVCEVGVMLGLPRWSVREALLEEVGLGDRPQLEALVDLFLQKTQDAPLLLSRVRQCNIRRAQLSERGWLLLKLLQEAEALLQPRGFLQDRSHACFGDHKDIMETIFSFLLWDCMAQMLEVPVCEPGRTVLDYLAELRGSEVVDVSLLQELEECLRDGGAEALGQSVRVLAQILRDLHPLQDCLHLSVPQEGTYSCRPRQLHRVTRFRGLLARVIRKAGGDLAALPNPDVHSLPRQYREACLRVGRLLERVCPGGGLAELQHGAESEATITQHLKFTLTQEAFSREVFDAGVKHRLLGILEFSPAQLGLKSLMQLHLETLSRFERYLQQGEHHSFQFVLESVRMLGGTQLCFVERTRGLVAIDNGMEEIYRFVTSDPASFLVRICCRGYDRECWFEVRNPRCVRVAEQDWANLEGMNFDPESMVLAEEGGSVWVREGRVDWMEKLQVMMPKNNLNPNDHGCCFKVTSQKSECKIKFIYKDGQISISAVADCHVL